MSVNDDADRMLRQAWHEIELKESMVSPTPFDGPVQVEGDKTHMGTFHDAPFEIKAPMDHMNILLENGMTIFDNPKYNTDTKLHVLKGIFEQLVKDHEEIYNALSKK